jgi:PAS domain S-box-containing protein
MKRPQLSVVENEPATLETKVIRAWSDARPAGRNDVSRRAFEVVRERERRFHALLEALPAAIYTTDAAGKITYFNRAAVDLWGHRPTVGGSQWCGSWKLLQPDGAPMAHDECPMATTVREERPVRGVAAMAERPDGSRVPFMPYPTPLFDEEGALVGAVNMLMDISDTKTAEEQHALLVRELHHRVRNTLATVQAVMRTTARASTTIEEFEEAFVGRIEALSKTNDLLTENFQQAVGVRTLLANELDAYDGGARRRVRLAGPEYDLPSALAVPIGMAIHELATNAAKYGGLSILGGGVAVSWTVDGESEARRLNLDWIEHDGPPVRPPSRLGFGSRLLEYVLPRQLGAEVTLDYRPEGLRAHIALPLPA